jgi:hypothetical protein
MCRSDRKRCDLVSYWATGCDGTSRCIGDPMRRAAINPCNTEILRLSLFWKTLTKKANASIKQILSSDPFYAAEPATHAQP